MKNELTHLDKKGRARMVDVGEKPVTLRRAVAEATVQMQPATLALITKNKAPKGDVLAVARIAGIQAAKRTHELIPLCHQLPLSAVHVDFQTQSRGRLRIQAAVQCEAKTGVEMEALVAANVAGLTVYDMLKAADRGMQMTGVRLLEKSGGRSGHWKRKK
ncbi:MAG TPA: cyclic pyranopterin monophosphate synthase MoaC [Planctomycetota bacterium]|nr:cyclic pyranopterin monophosphate synthase MoaC [Planctomycetota bacterium]